uniref:Host HNS inhibition protein n=1 Tax=Salmonella phage Phylax-28 TaxID=3349226 RepID=A0AB74UQ40_9CAUD
MAKTFKLNVSFPMTIVVATDTITALKETREEARKIPAEKIAELTGETKFRAELFRGDRSEEELLELIYRAGIREFITKDMRNEIAGNEAKIRLGSVKVVFEKPSEKPYCCCEQISKVVGEPTLCANCATMKRFEKTV